MKVYSEKDKNGMLYVDCTECVRGSKGDCSCSAGAKVKKPQSGGCFTGKLLPNIDV